MSTVDWVPSPLHVTSAAANATNDPSVTFSDRSLRTGRVTLDPWGRPQTICGGTACVLRVKGPTKTWAVKVRTAPPDRHWRGRHQQLAAHLRDSWPATASQQPGWPVGRVRLLDRGVRLAPRRWVAAVKSDWIDGPTLLTAARTAAARSDQTTLLQLARAVTHVACALERAHVGHGDLAPSNLIIANTPTTNDPTASSGGVVAHVVDVDSMWAPGCPPQWAPAEAGQPGWAHPHGPAPFGPHAHRFATLAAVTQLTVAAARPELARPGHVGLVFDADDLADATAGHDGTLGRLHQLLDRSGTRDVADLLAQLHTACGDPTRTPAPHTLPIPDTLPPSPTTGDTDTRPTWVRALAS